MKKLLLLLACGVSISSIAQTNHNVNTMGNTWSPNTLTIDVGDSVTFANAGQGLHNLNGTTTTYPSNPVSFGMATSSQNWTYGFRFTVAGTYSYRCDVHSSMMTGTITVVGGAGLTETESSITLFPNPVENVLKLNVDATDYSVVVYDMLGNKLVTKEMHLQNELDLSVLNSGTYWVELNVNGNLETQRIIKK